MLPSEVGEIDMRVDLAFGADLAAPPSSWAWTSVTDRLLSQQVAVERGAADESQMEPTTVTVELDNTDGALTPKDPRSPWWPHVRRGTPLRVTLEAAATPALLLDGDPANNASTPDDPALDITAGIRLEFEGSIDWGGAGGALVGSTLIGKRRPATDDRSYLFWIDRFSRLVLSWSTDGTASTATAVAQDGELPWSGVSQHAVAVELDPDDGAGNHVVTFQTADSLDGPWTTISAVTVAGTTSIYAGAAPLEIGPTANPDGPFRGRCTRARVHDLAFTSGVLVANPDFTAEAPGTTSFVDSEGLTWTLNGDAEITATANRPRFVGQVNEIVPTWPYGDLSGPDPDLQPGDARVTVTASGITRRLSQGAKPLDSALYRRIMDDRYRHNLIAYWPLEDGSEATQGASPLPGVSPFNPGGDFRFAAEDSLHAAETAAFVEEGQPAGWTAPVPQSTPGDWELNMFVRLHGVPASGFFPLAHVRTTGTERTWILGITNTNFQLFAIDADGAGALVTSFGHTFNDPDFTNVWLLFFLRVFASGGVNWTVGWIPLNRSGTTVGTSGNFAGTVGRVTAVQNLFTAAPPGGFGIGHLVIQTGLPLGWLAQADVAFDGEPAAARFARLCAEESILYAVAGDPADTEPMGPQRVATLLELLGECAAADGGRMYELRDQPGLGYRPRVTLYNQAPSLVLDAATSDIATPFVPVLDDQQLRNDITVNRPDASSARVTDPESIATEGLYDESIDINVETDSQLPQQAAWRLALGTWPGLRYPTVTTELTAAPHQIDPWLDVDVGDRVQVLNLPPQHPTGVVDLLIEGGTESISPGRWTPELNCSPAGPWTVGVLDDDPDNPDTALSRLDTDGSELSGAIGVGSTFLGVAITDGPEWTTDPAEAPFDIVVGGERMTVTAVTGSAPTQLFAVTRAVNGITKAHAAGTPIRVADPFRLRL